MTFLPANLYHSGFTVPDLEAGVEALKLGGIRRWTAPKVIQGVTAVVQDRRAPARFQYAYSCDGPHHFELIQPLDNEVFDQPSHMTFHHFGFWTPDLAQDIANAAAAGFPLEIEFIEDRSGTTKVSYHKNAVTDIRFELVPESSKATWVERWNAVARE